MASSDVIAEFLMAIGFTVDGASERRVTQSARRVEAAVRQADASTTRAQVSGSNIRTLQANRELGVRTKGAASLIAEMKQQQVVEGATTVQVVRATRVRSVAHAEAATKSSRYSAAAVRFTQGLATTATLTTAAIVGTSATLATAAISATTVIEKMASGFERLFYASQRTGASAGGLRSFGYAASQLGSSQQEAIGSLEAVAGRIRRSSGYETMLKGLGVATHDASGNVLSFEKRILSLGRILAKRPVHQQIAYGDALGIDENTLRSMTSGEMEKAVADYEAMMAKAGLDPDKADKDSKAFMDVYRRLWAGVNIIATKIQGALVGSFGDRIGKLTAYLLDNADRISASAIRVGETILRFVDSAVSMVKAFNDLNPKTKDFIVQLGLLVAGIMLLNGGPFLALAALSAGIVALYNDYERWKNGATDTFIPWAKWEPAIKATIEACAKIAEGFDSVAKALTGQSGLTVAFELFGVMLAAKLLLPLGKAVGLMSTLMGLRPAGWLLSLLGVGGGLAVAGGAALALGSAAHASNSLAKGGLAAGVDPITGSAPGEEVGSGLIQPGQEGGGQRYLRDLVKPKENDTRSFRERLLPKFMGGKEAPAPAPASATPGETSGQAPAGGASRAPTSAEGRANVASWMEFAQKPHEEGGLSLTKEQAHGLVATMQGESGRNLNPGAYNPDDRGMPSGGTAQWRNDRLRNLQAFAEQRGTDWKDRGTQQQFLRHEMTGSGALGGGSERRAYEAIKKAETREESLTAGVSKFERPQYPGAEIGKRSQYLYGHDEVAPSPKAEPEQGGTFPNGAPKVLKPNSMPDAPGVTMAERSATPSADAPQAPKPSEPPRAPTGVMPEWRKKADAEAAAANQALGGGTGTVAPGLTMFKTTPLGVSGDTDNSRSTTIRGGDTTLNIHGVSDPKEVASMAGRTLRGRDEDLLRNMKVSYS